jgi:hypothetical protein
MGIYNFLKLRIKKDGAFVALIGWIVDVQDAESGSGPPFLMGY